MSTPLRVVGNQNVIRPDGFDKVKGQAIFASDISLPGMLWAGVKMSPYPRARIEKIDVSAARRAGYTVITANDIPTGLRTALRWILTPEGQNVNYAGEPVAAVAAPTESQAEDALSLINVTYTPLPFTLSILDALQPTAPQLDPGSPNNILAAAGGVLAEGTAVSTQTRIVRGDINAGFAQADVIVEDQLSTPTLSHTNMESRACVAQWVNGKLTMWISNQGPHGLMRSLASTYNLSLSSTGAAGTGGSAASNVRVMGGGTGVAGMTQGDKGGLTAESIICATLALKAGVPVKYFPTRMDNSLNSSKRYPVLGYVKIGAQKSTGLLTAIHARYLTNPGAYGTSGPSGSLGDIQDAYTCPNALFEGIAVKTNLYSFAGAFRDVGETQGHFIMEGPMDQMAEKLGLDPVKFRYMNMQQITPSGPLKQQDSGQLYTGFGQPITTQKVAQLFGWDTRWKGWNNYKNQTGDVRTGIGMAIMHMNKGNMSNPMASDVTILPDGTIQSANGISEHGSGMKGVIVVIVAEILGVNAADVNLVNYGDTDFTRDAGGQGGSRAARSAGMGAAAGAAAALSNLYALAVPYINTKFNLNVKPTDLSTLGKQIFVTASPTTTVAWTDVLKGTKGVTGVGNFFVPTGAAGNFTGRTDQTAMAEVQVDMATGNIKVLNYAACFGIGRVLWAKGLENQFLGGFSGAGGGSALYESELRDPITGKYINANIHDYGLMTWLDTPDPEKMQVTWNEYVDGFQTQGGGGYAAGNLTLPSTDKVWGPYGARGIGEPSVGMVAATIANAVYNATGARLKTIPFRPETVLAAIKAAGTPPTITVPPIDATNVPPGGVNEAF